MRDSRSRVLRCLLAAAAAGLLAIPTGAGATPAWPGPDGAYDWPGMKKCGSFPSDHRIYVYAGKGTRCGKARRVMKDYWSDDPARVERRSGRNGDYATLPRHPGWKCTSGSGGGSCTKGKRFAGYQN